MSDGKRFISWGGGKKIILWDYASNEQIRVYEGHTGGVNSLAFTPDGKSFVSVGSDKKIILWDYETGIILKIIHDGHKDALFLVAGEANCISIFKSSNGIVALTGHRDGKIRNWDLSLDCPNSSSRDLNTDMTRSDLLLSQIKKLSLQKNNNPHSPVVFEWDKAGELILPKNGLVRGAASINEPVFYYSTSIYPVLETFLIPVEGIAGINSKFLDVTLQCAIKTGQLNVFSSDVIKHLVYFKWKYVVQKWFHLDFMLTLVFSSLFLIHSIVYHLYVDSEDQVAFSLGCVLLAATYSLNGYFLLHEITKMYLAASRGRREIAQPKQQQNKKKLCWEISQDYLYRLFLSSLPPVLG